ncbi:MAG: hypothetical protein DWQ34_04505 [Planctomycetota bacterium]|nr:MAG: hypothetical protein DWQ29_21420 [Planctomycetota bacterium]REJ96216.1 MAG: hypothetical protein DWQ34_04505 [Planctomycetota bacterium]REK24468.1 MAG: hypothetical protein DWQ41_15750 [Planctomycetota bacterium]REK38657.1 MAG: hypothetical protein DWQ45_04535 [Planctomycetota bacterium]
MRIQVEFEAQLRTSFGRAAVDLDLPDGSTVAGALRAAADAGPDSFAAHLMTDSGIRPSLLIFVGDDSVAASDADAYDLSEGDRVVVMPPIAGG